VKKKLKEIGAAFLAAVTSPTAVKAERSVAALIVFRVALALGASAGLAEFISKYVHG